MAGPKSSIHVPFETGLDTKTDQRWLETGKSSVATNVVLKKNKVLDKRLGYSSATKNIYNSGAATLTNGDKLIVHNNTYGQQLLLTDGRDAWSYKPQGVTAPEGWIPVDHVPEPAVYRRDYTNTLQTTSSMDIAYGNGFVCVAWCENNSAGTGITVMAAIYDSASGGVVLQGVKLNTGVATVSNVQVNAFTSTFVVTFSDGGANLYGCYCDVTVISPTWSAPINFVANAVGGRYTSCTSQTNNLAVAYECSAANKLGLSVRTDKVAAVAAATVVEVRTAFIAMACCAEDNVIYVTYVAPNGGNYDVRAMSFDNVCAVVSALATVDSFAVAGGIINARAGMVRTAANKVTFLYGGQTVGDGIWRLRQVYWEYLAGVSTLSNPVKTYFNYTLHSKPFLAKQGVGNQTSGLYAVCYFPSNIQGTFYLVCFDSTNLATTQPPRPVATMAPRLASSKTLTVSLQNYACSAVQTKFPNINSWTVLCPVTTSVQGTKRLSLTSFMFDFDNSDRWLGAQMGGTTCLTGGMPMNYDGSRISELGFTWYPENIALAQSNVGGNNMVPDAVNAYNYSCCYVWTDAAGQVQRSAPSVPTGLILVGPNNTITLTIPTMTLTAKTDVASNFKPEIIIEVYRAKGSNVFNYVGFVNNDPTAATVTYADGTADVSANTILYTVGGTLDNYIPPSCLASVVHKNRFWLGGTDDGKTIWYSKAYTTYESPGFNELMTISVDGATDRVTALASMDERLIIFTGTSIFYVTGDGPNDSGGGSDLSPPQRITSDVGALEQRSVVSTKAGIMFVANAGENNGAIYLLTRSLEVVYIGKPVEGIFDTYQFCTAATLVPRQGQVRFALTNFNQSAGVVVVYDYVQNAWTQFELLDFDSGSSPAALKHAVVYNDQYNYVSGGPAAGGTVAVEKREVDSLPYADGLIYITTKVGTAWLKLDGSQSPDGGIEGFQRFMGVTFLGEANDNSNMVLKIYTDYAASVSPQTLTVPVSSSGSSFPKLPHLEYHVQPQSQKASAVRVEIWDTSPGTVGVAWTTGKGLKYVDLSVEVRPIGGSAGRRLPAFQKG